MKSTENCYYWDGSVLVLNILGKPGAKRNALIAIYQQRLKVSITSPAEAGQATAHLVRFLAGEFGVVPSAVTVVSGQHSPYKQLRIHAPKRWPAILGMKKDILCYD